MRKVIKKNKSFFHIGYLIVLSGFLIVNILGSQLMPSLYFSLINEEPKASVFFLKQIQSKPKYASDFLQQRNVFQPEIQNQILAEEIEQKNMINKFEQLLQKNNKSRDILYGLYLLHKAQGDDLAEMYLKRAKEVDPSIK